MIYIQRNRLTMQTLRDHESAKKKAGNMPAFNLCLLVPLVFYDNQSANVHAIIEINHVIIGQTDTTG